jgi:hypothetical protein
MAALFATCTCEQTPFCMIKVHGGQLLALVCIGESVAQLPRGYMPHTDCSTLVPSHSLCVYVFTHLRVCLCVCVYACMHNVQDMQTDIKNCTSFHRATVCTQTHKEDQAIQLQL